MQGQRDGKGSQIKALFENCITTWASEAVSMGAEEIVVAPTSLHSQPPQQRPDQKETELILKNRKQPLLRISWDYPKETHRKQAHKHLVLIQHKSSDNLGAAYHVWLESSRPKHF